MEHSAAAGWRFDESAGVIPSNRVGLTRFPNAILYSMDKRLFLALGLTVLVFVLTPIVFPGATRRRVTSTPRTSDTPQIQSRDTVVGAKPPLESAIPSVRPSLTARDSVTQTVASDTSVVEDGLTRYRLTNLGAAPVSIEMKAFRALNGKSGPVELVTPREPLLRFSAVVGQDTVPLWRISFRTQRSRTASGSNVVAYHASLDGLDVAIQYAFVPDSYLVRVRAELTGPRAKDTGYLLVQLPDGLNSAEADSAEDQRHFAYAVKPRRKDPTGVAFGKLKMGEQSTQRGPITWVAAKNKYFIVGLLKSAADSGGFEEVVLSGAPRVKNIASRAHGVVIDGLRNGATEFELYAGPQEWKRLIALGRDFENSNPYGGFLQPVVQPFATIVMRILLWMKRTLNVGYGWVLVIFGVTIRLLLWPLNQSAMRTSLKMQRLQPELSEVQKRYKEDPQRLNTEMMRVYKEHGMSPFSSFSGCLPMLLPMPVLFALFFVFQNTIEFRGVPFLWLQDISLKDPYYIIPILMGISMYALSWIGMRNAPPNPQSKMMSYMLPVMMTVFFLNLASGLNLYYAIQNLAALPQQWMIASDRAKAMPPKG
jgi:YidC/Oxa1 family membrane protein insertase